MQELISSYSAAGCNMSLKLRFLHSHWNFFPENTGADSDKHSKVFHQRISQIKNRYGGKWRPNMLADNCWSLIRETSAGENKRQKNTE